MQYSTLVLLAFVVFNFFVFFCPAVVFGEAVLPGEARKVAGGSSVPLQKGLATPAEGGAGVPLQKGLATPAEREEKTSGIEVALAIDVSEAMAKEDTLKNLTSALKLFVSLLDDEDSVALVTYAGNASTLLPLTTAKNKDAIFKAIDSITTSKEKADVNAALEGASNVLSREGKTRAIVIVSSNTGITEISGEKQALIGELKSKDVEVHSVALFELSNTAALGKVSLKTGGFLYTVTLASGIFKVFTYLFEDLKTPEMFPIDKINIDIDESIDRVSFVISKSKFGSHVALVSPDGVKSTAEKKEKNFTWLVTDVFDLVTINEPAHGVWKVSTGYSRDNRIYVKSHLNLMTNLKSSYIYAGKVLKIKAWMEVDGLTLNLGGLFRGIKVNAEITSPDGRTSNMELFGYDEPAALPGTSGNAVKQGLVYNRFVPEKPGTYIISVTASARGFDRKRSYTFAAVKFEPPKKTQQATHDKKTHKSMHGETSFLMSIVEFLILNMVIFGGIILYLKRDKINTLRGRLLGGKKGYDES
ncbi:MAG: VWA domain-containing protein [Nitrospirae bacterium]|nr:VWA domain-containing protein [Nitrospirota bacterium]